MEIVRGALDQARRSEGAASEGELQSLADESLVLQERLIKSEEDKERLRTKYAQASEENQKLRVDLRQS
jgi:hypothetical protein